MGNTCSDNEPESEPVGEDDKDIDFNADNAPQHFNNLQSSNETLRGTADPRLESPAWPESWKKLIAQVRSHTRKTLCERLGRHLGCLKDQCVVASTSANLSGMLDESKTVLEVL